MILVLMGVSGAGKTTLGQRLALELGWHFFEGDDYHSEANVRKMRAGIPLTDTDRKPWLQRLESLIRQQLVSGRHAILACSALKPAYRKRLQVDAAQVRFIHLAGDYASIDQRLRSRSGHFMPAGLLESQYHDLELTDDVMSLDSGLPLDELVARIKDQLGVTNVNGETETLLDGLMFPEAPRWRAGYLWFTDQHAQRILRVGMGGQAETVAQLDDLPGGLGWLPDGRLLVVSMIRRQIFQLKGKTLELYADLSGLASFHCNDMLVDPRGYVYVGNFGFDLHGGASQSPAELIRVATDGRAQVIEEDLIFPNGMVLSPDGGTLIVAETFACRLSAFSVSADGGLSDRRVWADLEEANPDGICLDEEGAIWVAAPNLGEVIRVAAGGEFLRRVHTRGAPYACMLGGEDRRTLFIASAETDDPSAARELKSGRIETIRVETAGTGLP